MDKEYLFFPNSARKNKNKNYENLGLVVKMFQTVYRSLTL